MDKTPLLVFLLRTALVTVVLLEVAQMVFTAVPEGSRQAIGPILTIINATILASIGWWALRKEGVRLTEIGLNRTRIIFGPLPILLVWIAEGRWDMEVVSGNKPYA